jgi:dTDP-4-dehydrorhamnose reductase
MTDMEILQIADQCGVVAVTKHEWDGKKFNHTDDYLDGDAAALVIFAKVVAQHEREACAKVCEQTNDGTPYNLAEACAEAIRARGKHD